MDYEKLAKDAGLVMVEVDGSNIQQGRTFTDRNTGQTKPLPGTQAAYIWQGGKYPVEVAVEFNDQNGPYKPGWYFLGGAVFASGDYGRINFKGTRELNLIECDLVFDSMAVASPTKKAA